MNNSINFDQTKLGLKDIILNRICHSKNKASLEITFTVPLNGLRFCQSHQGKPLNVTVKILEIQEHLKKNS